MTRVLLVKPDLAFVSDITPPLGLGYLAAAAREANHEVRILDNRLHHQGLSVFCRTLRSWRPDVIGISATSYEADAARDLAEGVRNELPKAKVIIGGTFPSADPEAALLGGLVDFAVLGEGERIFIEALDRIQGDRDVQDLPAIMYSDTKGGLCCNAPSPPIEDLDDLPFPAWDLLDLEAYSRTLRQGFVFKYRRYFPLFTSRGCPYRCIYCNNHFGKRFRCRSAEGVLAEIEQLVRAHEVREIHFVDDIFNLDEERAAAIFEGIILRGWNLALSFPNGVRGDLLNERLIRLMRRAGTYRVSVAFESGSERIQGLVRKNLDLEQSRENAGLLARNGILTHGFFMIGFPTETPEEAFATIRFACSTQLHSASFFYVNPFPGTELVRMIQEQGKSDVRELGRTNYYDPRVADLAISEIPPHELRATIRGAWQRFYFYRPQRLWRLFWRLPRKSQVLVLAVLVILRAFGHRYHRWERHLFLRKITDLKRID